MTVTTRPFNDDINLARALLDKYATRFEVFVYRVYEWKLNSEDGSKSQVDVKFRNQAFLPDVIESLTGETWKREYGPAFDKLSGEDKEYWNDITGKKVRQAWEKVSGLIYYALDSDQGGDMIKADISRKYEVRQDFVVRAIQAVGRMIAAEAPTPQDMPAGIIPQPLDYASDVAQNYYPAEALSYYQQLLSQFMAEDDKYEIDNPIVATLIHQLILNTYTIQVINQHIAQEKDPARRGQLLKRLEEIQKTTSTVLREIINIQKELGRLEKKEESLGALKRRLEEVQARRAQEIEAQEKEDEANMYGQMLLNTKHLGLEQ